jgi:hypothetical protein
VIVLQVTHQREASRRAGPRDALPHKDRDMSWPGCHLAVVMRAAFVMLWLFGGLLQPAAAEHAKIDVIELTNNDRITGEIKGMDRGRLTVKTDALETVAIEWPKVRRVQSPFSYQVELTSGVRLLGIISSPADSQMYIADADQPTTVPMEEVARIIPIEAGFWQRLDGSISFGFSYTESDHRTQWSLNTTTDRRTPKFLTTVTFSSLLTRQQDEANQTRNTGTVLVARFLARHWFAGALAQLSENEELGLRLRSVTGAGIGRSLIQTPRTNVAVLGGAAYTHESYTEQSDQSRAEAVLGLEWDWFTFGDRETTITLSAQNYYGLSGPARFRSEVNASLSRKVFKDFTITGSLIESFDSSPPANERKNDLSLTIGVGWTF